MTIALIVLCIFALLLVICRHLEGQIRQLFGIQYKTSRRVARLEQHESNQDSRIDHQQVSIKRLREDVNEIRHDVGSVEARQPTQIIKRQ